MECLVKTSNGLYVHYNPQTSTYFVHDKVGACVFYKDTALQFIAHLENPSAWHLETLEGHVKHYSLDEASSDPAMRELLVQENMIKK